MKYALSPEHQVVLQCYRAYFTGEVSIETPINSDLRLMLRIAQMHQIDAMVYHVLRKTEYFKNSPKEIQSLWKGTVLQQVYEQENRNDFLGRIYTELENNKVNAVILKGITLRDVYPNPEYRYSSDEDIWIQCEQAECCDKVLRQFGFRMAQMDGLDTVDLSRIHDISYFNSSVGMTVELQFNPIGADIQKRIEINESILPMFARQRRQVIAGVSYRCLDITDNVFFVFAHMTKHFLHQGASIRMCSDIGLLCKRYYELINWKSLYDLLKLHKLEGLFVSVVTMCQKELGIECVCPWSDDRCNVQEELIFDIMSGGAYGTYTKPRKLSSVLTEYDMDTRGKAVFGKLSRCLFPKYTIMQRYYPVICKRKWMLPLCWINRLCRIVFNFETRKEYMSAYLEGERRMRLFRNLGI